MPLPLFRYKPYPVSLKALNRLVRGQKTPLTKKRIENALKRYKQGLIKSRAHERDWKLPKEISGKFIMGALEGKKSRVTCKIFVTPQKKYILQVERKTNKNGVYVYNIPLKV